MKKTKRLVAALLCAISCFALIACGETQEDSSSKDSSDKNSTSGTLGDDVREDIFN